MDYLEQSFEVSFNYKVCFTSGIFHSSNKDFDLFLREHVERRTNQKILIIIDNGVLNTHPQLPGDIETYFKTHKTVSLVDEIIAIPGGENAKNNSESFDLIVQAID
jgi:3-dehydroquinate synthase